MVQKNSVNPRELDRWQRQRQHLFKSVPSQGAMVSYLGKDFIVYQDTFWPFQDSLPLVKHLKIKNTEKVLDIGTGSGVIAIFAGLLGAKSVLASDINPQAIKTAKANAKLHGLSKKITVIKSDVFDSLPLAKFDVITANLPFRNKKAPDMVAKSQWDSELSAHRKFFEGLSRFLKVGGRAYLSQSNFGPLQEIRALAKVAGFKMELLGKKMKDGSGPEIFYAFLLTRI